MPLHWAPSVLGQLGVFVIAVFTEVGERRGESGGKVIFVEKQKTGGNKNVSSFPSVFIVRGIQPWAMKGAVFAKLYHRLITAVTKKFVLGLVLPPSQYMPPAIVVQSHCPHRVALIALSRPLAFS